jgi:hypothetical protein
VVVHEVRPGARLRVLAEHRGAVPLNSETMARELFEQSQDGRETAAAERGWREGRRCGDKRSAPGAEELTSPGLISRWVEFGLPAPSSRGLLAHAPPANEIDHADKACPRIRLRS